MNSCVGFGALTEVVTKSSTCWDITLCSPLKIACVSEEHVASIFSVDYPAKKKISVKQVASNYLLINRALIIGIKSY
jgi:hypothetical protein